MALLLSIPMLFLVFVTCFYRIICFANTIPVGFVYVHDRQISLRYSSEENFLGHVVNGYLANALIMIEAAAIGLKTAQILANEKGYELVIYNGYRPQKSVNQFVNWSQNLNGSQIKNKFYYPHVNKEDTFKLGYPVEKSRYTRGSTIDLTLISLGKHVKNLLQATQRTLSDNSTIFCLDDDTIDMGSI